MTEKLFITFNPFFWCFLLSLFALILFYLRYRKIAFVITAFLFILQSFGLIWRSYLAGRAPVTNMYETVLGCGYFAFLMMLVFYFKRRERLMLYMGLALNAMTLAMVNFATNMLDSRITSLMPVLRSNFWLSIHVTTIIIAYSALALSWIFSNAYLISNFLGRPLDSNRQSKWIYEQLKVGIVFLILGIVTGAIWADYSWGRFWGWDPKETWALIVLLLYMAILHGKYTSWLSRERFIQASALAFLFVMMAWFGVNYILSSGLHAYGFSQGGALFLLLFTSAQLALSSAYWIKKTGA